MHQALASSPKPEVILTNFFAEPTVLLVSITSRAERIEEMIVMACIYTCV
jgi:hypothetical protein